MTSKLLQILDDNAPDFKYSGGQWTLSSLVQWYQETSNFPAFASDTQFGSFTLTFEGSSYYVKMSTNVSITTYTGKSIAFIGNTPPLTTSQTATVTIDGGEPSTITYPGIPQVYAQWYQSPTLPEGSHNITVARLGATAVDYALIEVGQDTPLSGKTLVVDNDDSAIYYTGSWIRDMDEFDAGSLPDGFPLHNSTHRSSTVGDTITFRFSGTSFAVYGIFSWTNLGILGATYTVDGSTTQQSYPVTISSTQYVNGAKDASNLQYYSQDNLPPGPHTLVINITQSQNVTYMLDYITYIPSFSTLSTMPNVSDTETTTTTTIGTQSSSATSSNSMLAMTPIATQNGQETGLKAISLSTGAIVAAVAGGSLLLALIVVLMLWLRRRRIISEQSAAIHPCISRSFLLRKFPLHTETRLVDATSNYTEMPQTTREVALPVHYRNTRPPTGLILPFQDSTENSTQYRIDTIADLKRERYGTAHSRLRSSSIASPTGGSTSRSETGLSATNPAISMDLEYLSVSAESPPAYDAFSTVPRTNLTSHSYLP